MMSQALLDRRMIGIAAVSLVLSVSGALGQGQNCPDGSENVTRVDITVNYEAGRILVEPESTTIYLNEGPGNPGKVCWIVHELKDGQTLHIQAKSGQAKRFTGGPKRIQGSNNSANSGRPTSEGGWLYDVFVTTDGKRILEKDPEVIIKRGGGG